MWDDEKFVKALQFATEAHKGQRMLNGEGIPYILHVYSVMQYAVKYAIESRMDVDWNLLVQVALLHDTIEDTHVTYKIILEKFGKAVADGVWALSRNLNLARINQMQDCINKIKSQPKEIAMIKMADRIFNLRDKIPTWSKERIEFYKQEAQLICDELGYACKTLKQALQEQIDRF